jgi:hypothetical protein
MADQIKETLEIQETTPQQNVTITLNGNTAQTSNYGTRRNSEKSLSCLFLAFYFILGANSGALAGPPGPDITVTYSDARPDNVIDATHNHSQITVSDQDGVSVELIRYEDPSQQGQFIHVNADNVEILEGPTEASRGCPTSVRFIAHHSGRVKHVLSNDCGDPATKSEWFIMRATINIEGLFGINFTVNKAGAKITNIDIPNGARIDPWRTFSTSMGTKTDVELRGRANFESDILRVKLDSAGDTFIYDIELVAEKTEGTLLPWVVIIAVLVLFVVVAFFVVARRQVRGSKAGV